MEADALTYRPFEEPDVPGLLRLWEESGWGTLDEETWREWYVRTPHGPCLIVVALDAAGEVAGQLVFTPAAVNVEGRPLRALRMSAPILRADIRGVTMRRRDHPAIGLFLVGLEAAARAGVGLIYAMPEHAWLPFFRWGPVAEYFAAAEFACVALPLDAGPGSAPGRAVAARASTFEGECSELWDTARPRFPLACSVERGAAWLRWRHGGHLVVAVREGAAGPLLGYAAVRRHDGLLMDALAATPEALREVLAAALGFLATTPGAVDEGVEVLKAMRTPVLAPVLDALGFAPDPYRFAFVCCPLDPALPREAVAPERWYAMPGD